MTKQWHVHPVATARERQRKRRGDRTECWQTRRERKMIYTGISVGGEGETSCSDKNLLSWWLQSKFVYLQLSLCTCRCEARYLCLRLAGWSLSWAVRDAAAIVPSHQAVLRDLTQWSSLYISSSRAECFSHTNGDVMNRYSGEVSLFKPQHLRLLALSGPALISYSQWE